MVRIVVDLGVLEYDTLDQGRAASCTIHAVINCIRGILELKGYMVIPSVQDPINCCDTVGNNRDGWRFEHVLNCIKVNGLTLEVQYPFVREHQDCIRHHPKVLPPIQPMIFINDFTVTRLMYQNERAIRQLKSLLDKKIPVCVSLYVGREFDRYELDPATGLFEAVYEDSNQPGVGLHAMVLTGYDESSWKAKNSYGRWGRNGFVFINQRHTWKFKEVAFPRGVQILPLPPLPAAT